MVTYDPIRVAAAAVLLTLFFQHVPGFFLSIWKHGILRSIKIWVMKVYMRTPGMRKKLEDGEKKMREKIIKVMLKHREKSTRCLPNVGGTKEEIIEKMRSLGARDRAIWDNGKVSGGVYHGGESLSQFQLQAIEPFLVSNPLHPDLFPAVRQMESEIVQMTAELFHADTEVRGVLTSGGTESLLMMMYAYREWGRRDHGISSPEIIAPRSAHASISKGADYFGIKVIYIDVNPETLQADVSAMENAINNRTVALVCSVPSFPHGVIDPVQALAEVAIRRKVNLHVDCCLGGFLVPFMTEAGYPIPRFDFLLSGVTSISCDPHKYGCTPKGVSVLLYRSAKLRSYQYFMEMEWSGGLYFTPSMSGSRSGALAAAAWATLVHFGRDGYVQNAKEIVTCARRIRERSSEVPDLMVMGDPLSSIIAFKSDTLNIQAVADIMLSEFGWSLNNLQQPAAFHICVTNANCRKADDFIRDLKTAVSKVKEMKDLSNCDAVAIYGLAEALPDRTYMKFVGEAYLDCLFMA